MRFLGTPIYISWYGHMQVRLNQSLLFSPYPVNLLLCAPVCVWTLIVVYP